MHAAFTPARLACCGVAALLVSSAEAQQDSARFTPDLWGIEYTAADPEAMVRFYTEAAGFELLHPPQGRGDALLRNGDLHVVVRRGAAAPPRPTEAAVQLNLRVAELAAAARRARTAGGVVPSLEPQPFALGKSIALTDPAGYPLHFVDLEARPLAPGKSPAIFNVALVVPDIDACESSLTRIGFEVFSRAYLPRTLPFQRHGAAALVVHPRAVHRVDAGRTPPVLWLTVDDLDTAHRALRRAKVAVVDERTATRGQTRSLRLTLPSGQNLRIVGQPPPPPKAEPEKQLPKRRR